MKNILLIASLMLLPLVSSVERIDRISISPAMLDTSWYDQSHGEYLVYLDRLGPLKKDCGWILCVHARYVDKERTKIQLCYKDGDKKYIGKLIGVMKGDRERTIETVCAKDRSEWSISIRR